MSFQIQTSIGIDYKTILWHCWEIQIIFSLSATFYVKLYYFVYLYSGNVKYAFSHPSFFAPNGNCLGQMSPKLSQTAATEAISWSKRITINLQNSRKIQDFHKLNTTLSHSDMGRRSHLATYFLKEANRLQSVSFWISVHRWYPSTRGTIFAEARQIQNNSQHPSVENSPRMSHSTITSIQ